MTTILKTFQHKVVCNQPLIGTSKWEVHRDECPVVGCNLPFGSIISWVPDGLQVAGCGL